MQQFNDAVLWVRDHSIVPMLVVFVIIAVATYWPSRRKDLESQGMILFHDDDR